MRTITETITVYTFGELSEEAKQNAIETYQRIAYAEPYDWWDDAFASLKEFISLFDGVEIEDYNVGLGSHSYVDLNIDRYDNTIGYYCSCEEDYIGISHIRLWKWLHNNPVLITGKQQWTSLASIAESANCEFTGYCADESLLDPIREFLKTPDHRTLAELIYDCVDSWLAHVIADMEYQCSEEYAREAIEANDYEFTESGELYV